MTLDLTYDEVLALSRFLDDHLGAFQREASRTDAPDAKREMWQMEHQILALRDRLRRILAAAHEHPDVAP